MVMARPPLALMCEDDTVIASALVDTANGQFGFAVVAPVRSGAEAVEASSRIQPDLVVIDIALLGEVGLRIIPVLVGAVPGRAVVVVAQAPFERLRGPAIAAGAMALVELSDLRQLRPCLRRVAAAVNDPLACSGLTPVGARSTATRVNLDRSQARVTASPPVAGPGVEASGAANSSGSEHS